jgi:hypothetical protein
VALLAMLRVDVNEGLPELGLKLPVAPDGRPDTLRLTGCGLQLLRVSVTTEVMVLPASTVMVGDVERVKSRGCGATVSVACTLLVFPPPVPATVKG